MSSHPGIHLRASQLRRRRAGDPRRRSAAETIRRHLLECHQRHRATTSLARRGTLSSSFRATWFSGPYGDASMPQCGVVTGGAVGDGSTPPQITCSFWALGRTLLGHRLGSPPGTRCMMPGLSGRLGAGASRPGAVAPLEWTNSIWQRAQYLTLVSKIWTAPGCCGSQGTDGEDLQGSLP